MTAVASFTTCLEGEQVLLDRCVGKVSSSGSMTAHLFKNNYIPVPGSSFGSFGLSAAAPILPMMSMIWTPGVSGAHPTNQYPLDLAWNITVPAGTTETFYGFFVSVPDVAGNRKVIMAGLFAAPQVVSSP